MTINVKMRTQTGAGFWVELLHPEREQWELVEQQKERLYYSGTFQAGTGKPLKCFSIFRQTDEYRAFLAKQGFRMSEVRDTSDDGCLYFTVDLPEDWFKKSEVPGPLDDLIVKPLFPKQGQAR